jgi:hypothetical protein
MRVVLFATVGAVALWQSDFDSASRLHSVVAPCIVAIAAMGLLFWTVFFLKRRGIRQTGDSMHD